MEGWIEGAEEGSAAFVSTGRLPPDETVARRVDEAHARFAGTDGGVVSQAYPSLARMRPDLFGLCVVGTDGGLSQAGDSRHPFTLMSVSKPFVFALACAALGVEPVRARVGANATGLPFNSLAALERSPDGRTNPMVNPGAMVATSLAPGGDREARWRFILDGLSRFAGRPLALDREVYDCAIATNARNRAIAQALDGRGLLGCPPDEAVDLYSRQCCLQVNARDLAAMGATLANGGVNPVSGVRVVAPMVCHYTLAVMVTAGLYEASGDWLFDVGLPAKSGISGGIVTVSPGKGALGVFAPPLDGAGNSIKGRHAARFLSQALGMDLLVSLPGGQGPGR